MRLELKNGKELRNSSKLVVEIPKPAKQHDTIVCFVPGRVK